MGFMYKIENCEVTITAYKDKLVKSVIIPELILGCPATKISTDCFYYYELLEEIIIPNSVIIMGSQALPSCIKSINNTQVNRGVNIINNKFIFFNGFIYIIYYQILGDYYCEYNCEYNSDYENRYRYFINGERFLSKFRCL